MQRVPITPKCRNSVDDRQHFEARGILRTATGQAVLDAVVDTTPSFLLIADSHGKILRESRYVAELTGGTPSEVAGLTVAQFNAMFQFNDPHGRRLEAKELSLVRALKGEQVRGFEGSLSSRGGERIPFVSNAAPIQTRDGEVIGAITSTTDLRRFKAIERDLRAAVAEKEMLYWELTHRVKNHLQMISGLIKLEARDAGSSAEMAERMSGHLKMLAGAYDRMTQAEVGGRVAAREFIQDVVRPYRTASVSVEVTAPEDLTLSPDAAGPFGMLVNEAVCNSYKHAFADRPGRIEVTLRPTAPDRLELAIADDGIGYPGATDRSSQGLKLMRLLAQQLGGEVEISGNIGGGCRVVVSLPASLAQTPHGGSLPGR
jgi:PAS domain S-box-containing protein